MIKMIIRRLKELFTEMVLDDDPDLDDEYYPCIIDVDNLQSMEDEISKDNTDDDKIQFN